jgi:hypothetical protein
MPDLPRFRTRLSKLREILDSRRERLGLVVGVITPPAAPAEIAAQDGYMRDHLGCAMPEALRSLLAITKGFGTQGTVVYGTDEPNNQNAGTWPKKGVIYATLTRRETFGAEEWLVVAENEFDLFVMSPAGRDFAVRPFSGPTVPLGSLDDLLCRAVDIMIRSNPPTVA